MTTLQNTGRQTRLVAEQAVKFSDLTNGAAAGLKVSLPAGAIVLGGGLLVETPWNAATSAVLDVGQVGGANRFANDLDLKTAGFKPFTGVGLASLASTVDMTLTEVGTSTAGSAVLIVEYIVRGRANEVQVR